MKGLGVKAVVLTAGAGTRLRPLTYEVAKPLVPVLNRPILHYVLSNLQAAGIGRAILNLHNFPQQIRACSGDGSAWGLKASYSLEAELLGTAGAVKRVEGQLRDSTFLVLSGDGLSDVDLAEAVAFHRERRALATLVTTRRDSRFEYGVALSDGRGRVKGFVEKPRWGDVFSDRVNTGIYIFEPEVLKHLPQGRSYDFGHELFPKLVKLGKPVYAFLHEGYWCDVGNLAEYRRGNIDALEGRVDRVRAPGREARPGVWIEPGAVVHPEAKLAEPCLVGRRARVSSGAVVGPHTTLGEGSRVDEQAVVKNCILWPKARVGAGAHLEGCVVGSGVRVQARNVVYHAELLSVRV